MTDSSTAVDVAVVYLWSDTGLSNRWKECTYCKLPKLGSSSPPPTETKWGKGVCSNIQCAAAPIVKFYAMLRSRLINNHDSGLLEEQPAASPNEVCTMGNQQHLLCWY